jgi:hypothetical protein
MRKNKLTGHHSVNSISMMTLAKACHPGSTPCQGDHKTPTRLKESIERWTLGVERWTLTF